MEPAILGVLAIMLTVMLYLDRTRRADSRDLRADMSTEIAALRVDMSTEIAALRVDMSTEIAALRKEMNDGFAALREEIRTSSARTDARIDQLTTAVINLAESLGQVKGRTEVLVASE